MKVGKYELVNKEKVRRALDGVVAGSGNKVGGIATPDGSYEDSALLAEYDRLGGYIKRGGDKVKTGSFYDFKVKKPREKPKVSFLFRVNGKEIEVADGEEMPGLVKAARILAADASDKDEEKAQKALAKAEKKAADAEKKAAKKAGQEAK